MIRGTVDSHSGKSQLDAVMLRLVDVGIAATIFIAPLFMGGRGPVGKFAFITMAAVTAVVWSLRQCLIARPAWRRSGVEWLLLAGLVLIILQLVPLPTSLVSQISPTLRERLPLWSAGSEVPFHLGQWSQTSLAPAETRAALIVYMAYAMLFLVVVQRLDSLADIERVLRWLAAAAILMAGVGLLQFLVGNGKFLWIYEHPFRVTTDVVKGAFQNQNHFAQFLALGIGPLIWWLWNRNGHTSVSADSSNWNQAQQAHQNSGFGATGRRPANRSSGPFVPWQLLAVGMGLLFIAGLLTFSRGGVIAIAVAAISCLTVYFRKSLLGIRSFAAMAAMIVVVVTALSIHGYEQLAFKLGTFRSADSLDTLSRGRSALWSALLQAAPDFAVLGAGIGSHRYVYPMYLDEYFGVDFTHGESGYLSLLLEAGVPGLALMMVGIAYAFWWSGSVAIGRVRSSGRVAEEQRTGALAAAILAGLVASLVHSFGDFVWYISACMSLTVILAACGCRLFQLTRPGETTSEMGGQSTRATVAREFTDRQGLLVPWFATGAVLLIAIVMIHDRLPVAMAAPHWDQYRGIATGTDFVKMQATDDEQTHEQIERMIVHLEQAVACNPGHARAHVRLAALSLRAFEYAQLASENPMGLAQIRDAALMSQFESRQAQDEWLERAVEERRSWLDKARAHAMRGLRLSPVQGEAYTYLAELSFLDSPRPDVKQAYLVQAERVRPHDGVVQFALGRESLMAGDVDEALDYWRQAFAQDPEVQGLIIQLMTAHAPAHFFIEQFRPDRKALGALHYRYRNLDRVEDARVAGQHYLRALIAETLTADATEAANLWHQAAGVYEFLGDQLAALECQQKAVDLAPRDYGKRRSLARRLLQAQQYDKAVSQLQWCLRRSADDLSVKKDLEVASKRALKNKTEERVSAHGTVTR